MGILDKFKKRKHFAFFITLLIIGSLYGCSTSREEKVYDAAYDAEDIIVQKLGLEYEHLHMGNLPFYTGDNERHVILYANAEETGQPFDRIWIYPCETESEAIQVLDDFEAYLGDGMEWRRDDEAISGKEVPGDIGYYLTVAMPYEPWQRDMPGYEITSHITEESSPFLDKTEVYWYARRHKTLVLIMDKVHYQYEVDGETYGTTPEEWETEKKTFDVFFENTVDIDEFWS